MARITQAAFDAAVEQAKKEGAEAASGIISAIEAERDEWKSKAESALTQVKSLLDEQKESAKRSIANAIEHNKGGAWRENRRAWYVLVAIAIGLIGLLIWSLNAKAQEPGCKPAYPPGLTIVCINGYWWIDTDELPNAVRTDKKCIDRRS